MEKKDFGFADYYDVIQNEASQYGEFGFNCSFRGQSAYVESDYDYLTGRQKINIYYGANGPFGSPHNHAVAYRDTPFDIIADEVRV